MLDRFQTICVLAARFHAFSFCLSSVYTMKRWSHINVFVVCCQNRWKMLDIGYRGGGACVPRNGDIDHPETWERHSIVWGVFRWSAPSYDCFSFFSCVLACWGLTNVSTCILSLLLVLFESCGLFSSHFKVVWRHHFTVNFRTVGLTLLNYQPIWKCFRSENLPTSSFLRLL